MALFQCRRAVRGQDGSARTAETLLITPGWTKTGQTWGAYLRVPAFRGRSLSVWRLREQAPLQDGKDLIPFHRLPALVFARGQVIDGLQQRNR